MIAPFLEQVFYLIFFRQLKERSKVLPESFGPWLFSAHNNPHVREAYIGVSNFALLHTLQWKRKWQPTPVFFPEESRGQRSLAGYSPWGCKESDMTEWLTHTQTSQWHSRGRRWESSAPNLLHRSQYVLHIDLGKSEWLLWRCSFMQPNFKCLSFTCHFIPIKLPFVIVNIVLVLTLTGKIDRVIP